MIDWTDPNTMVSQHFSVRDAIWLPKWGRIAAEPDGLSTQVCDRLSNFFKCFVDPLCNLLSVNRQDVRVHCCYRPRAYNAEIGGAKQSAHMCLGDWAALDFDILNQKPDVTRALIIPHLESLGLRMEDMPGSDWVHIDNHPVLNHRWFKP